MLLHLLAKIFFNFILYKTDITLETIMYTQCFSTYIYIRSDVIFILNLVHSTIFILN